MGWLDQVAGAGDLYISGLHALGRTKAIRETGITHVVSVLRWSLEENLVERYKHLQIDIEDDDAENLLVFFPVTYRFIEDALRAGGSVLVHCAVGKSRSAAVVVAYLMKRFRLETLGALNQLRQTRSFCEPNPGFMHQLDLYQKMGYPDDVETHIMYQRWLFERELSASRSIGQAPDADMIRFEDEHVSNNVSGGTQLRCRKCRRALATSKFLVDHKPKEKPNDSMSLPVPVSACSHYFLDALSWMRPELEQGKLDGRLECPKCKTNVGKYAWHGMQCNCGDWIVPGISLAKSRVDEAQVKPLENATSMGIRLPPGMSRPPSGRGNL